MAITATEIVAAIDANFDDASEFGEAMTYLALLLAKGDTEAKIATANNWLTDQQNKHGEYIAARQAELAGIQAQLDAIAGSVEP